MTYPADPGNVDAAVVVGGLLAKYKPRLLVMIGMAGGISSSVKLLDVAISREVIYYEPRKELEHGVSARLQALPVSSWMKRAVTHFLASHGAPNATLRYVQAGVQHEFEMHDGPIGTGEAIVASKTSRSRLLVQQANDKALIVETEAWGLHKAVLSLEALHGKCHVLTIKGVADTADGTKDDSRQYRATRNAFETLRQLLASLTSDDLAK